MHTHVSIQESIKVYYLSFYNDLSLQQHLFMKPSFYRMFAHVLEALVTVIFLYFMGFSILGYAAG